jgi:cytochrome c-type biogenesis protein CcmH/NrfF
VIRRVATTLLLALALLAPAGALAETPRTTLSDVEDEVMCPICGTALNVAGAPQADAQRALIRRLIAEGKTKDQIKQALVAEYGENVLGVPDNDGFGIAVWLVPVGLVAALLALAAVFLPRWRRRARGPAAVTPGPALSAADARRLDEDIARYEP